MGTTLSFWQRTKGAVGRRHLRDIQDLDARGRLGYPPKPYMLAVASFVLVVAMGLLAFVIGRSQEPTAYLLVATFGVFGLATAIGFALVAAQYRTQQDLDAARTELLTVHADLAIERQEIDSVLHDAKAMVAAISATLHTLTSPGSDAQATQLLSREIKLLCSILTPQRIRPVPTSLIGLLDEVRPIADAHGVVLEVDVDPGLEVLADQKSAIQIFENLIDNTRKYAPDSPVEVSTQPAGPFVRVLFEDRGPGINGSPEVLFASGTRSSSDTQGFGMGLGGARRLAEAMGGSLWYEPRPGGGARFVVKLALAEDSREGPA